jgi:hypothetical protein
MSTSQNQADREVLHGPAKQPYAPPLLTRNGTVEELTHTITTDTSTGSGIPTDFASTQ